MTENLQSNLTAGLVWPQLWRPPAGGEGAARSRGGRVVLAGLRGPVQVSVVQVEAAVRPGGECYVSSRWPTSTHVILFPTSVVLRFCDSHSSCFSSRRHGQPEGGDEWLVEGAALSLRRSCCRHPRGLCTKYKRSSQVCPYVVSL